MVKKDKLLQTPTGDVLYATAAVRGEGRVGARLRQKEITLMNDESPSVVRGNARIERLAERADLADDVGRARSDQEDADRTCAMGLAAPRQAVQLTRVEVAMKLGVRQAAVSHVARPHDLLLSTPLLSTPN